ncbi:MAG TPA: aminotransferase class I/II-fold pyridoxal phosphate-dependent enzyme, partial [Bacteroidetes bacterium]|nr:aminotransferase class I/II-fold pyridoxal phosphate-dependent enzyme [Bacteroidota bacterium]
MHAPPSKLPTVGTTIFSVMSALAAEHEAINLSQGFPDFDCDPHLFNLVQQAMHAGHNQYAPMPGVPILRERIAGITAALYGAEYDPEHEITITAGATAALFAAISAVVHPGDEVIVLEPAYDSYVPVITLCGGTPVFVRLTWPEYGIDWQVLRRALSPRTRMIILNSPHNP